MYADDIVLIDKNVRTRAYERYHAKLNRQRRGGILSSLRQNENILDTDKTLKYSEFLVICVFMQMDLNYVLGLLNTIIQSNAAYTLAALTLLGITINLPTFMLYTFLGKYTRYGYIQIWNISPVLKGVGYMVMGCILIRDLYISTIACYIVLLIYDSASNGIVWRDCKFNNGSQICIAVNKEFRIKYKKPVCDVSYATSAEIYMWKIYRENLKGNPLLPNIKVIIILCFIWTFLVFVSYKGLQKFAKFAKYHSCIVLSLLAITSILILFVEDLRFRENIWTSSETSILSGQFWANVILLCLLSNMPGNYIFLGAIMPRHANAGGASIFVIFTKLFLTTFIIILTNIIMNTLISDYGLGSLDKCNAASSSFAVIFAYFPDIISRTLFGTTSIFVYYITLLCFALKTLICMTTAAVESFLQEIPESVKRFRFLIFVSYGIIAFVINIFYIGTNMMLVTPYLISSLIVICILCTLLLNITITFLYPISRLYTDFHFMYGHRLIEFWTIFWRICPLMLLFTSVITFIYYKENFHEEVLSSSVYFVRTIIALLLAPLIIIVLWIIFRHFQSLKTKPILFPETTWGPYGEGRRAARRMFFPERELKYLGTAPKCKHKCLIRSTEYASEVYEQIRKFREIICNLEEKHNRRIFKRAE